MLPTGYARWTVAVSVAAVGGVALHTLTRYGIARLWTGAVELDLAYRVLPWDVVFHSPARLSTTRIRLLSVGTFLVWRALLVGVALRVGVPHTPVETSLYVGTVAAALGSPVALLGAFFPRRFREVAASRQRLGYRRAAREIHDCVVDVAPAA